MQISKAVNYIQILLKYSHNERIRLFRITYIIIKAFFFVNYMPIKYFFYKYSFGKNRENFDLQLYRKEIRLIRKIGQLLPFRVTCLIECMAIQEYMKKYEIVLPISLGLKNIGDLSAHAWICEIQANDYINIFTRNNERSY